MTANNPNGKKDSFKIGLMAGMKKDPDALKKQLAFYQSQITTSREQYEKAQKDIVSQFDQLSEKTDNILGKFQEIFTLFNESQENLVENIRKAVLNFLPDEYPDDVKRQILAQLVEGQLQKVEVVKQTLVQTSGTLTMIVEEFKDSKWAEASLNQYKENSTAIQQIIETMGRFKEGYIYGESISQE
ncbi:MAG: hypothetical protein AAFR61_05485 [Bacteroidota bacterium]